VGPPRRRHRALPQRAVRHARGQGRAGPRRRLLQREGAGQGVPGEDRQVADAGRGATQSAWAEKW